MKNKIKNILMISFIAVTLAVTAVVAAFASTKVSAEEHVYYTNFEGLNINGSSTADANTGFIWSNDWQNTKSVNRNGSTMLEMSVFDSTTYSIIGGFGIADKSNLGRCTHGEAYDVETYFEMVNMEFAFVEFVGGDGKWGSVKIYPDGSVLENTGGDNLSNVSYVDNILRFTFTMSFNGNENVNGYIKFTAYNTKNGKVYLDNVSIDYAEHVINDTYEQMPVGVFDTHVASIFNHYYAEGTTTSSFVRDNNDTEAEMSFTLDQNTDGVSVFFVNKLGFLNKNRDYTLSMELKMTNISNLWIYQGGTWCEPHSYIQINSSGTTVYGQKIKSATYKNNILTMEFNTNVNFNDWKQFQFIAQATEANVKSTVRVDNLKITQTPIVEKIALNTTNVKTKYLIGESLDLTNLVVNASYTNGITREVSISNCQITGYDSNKNGLQIVSVTYEGAVATFKVSVSREVKSIVINKDELKKNYARGEEIDLSNLKVEVTYLDNGENDILTHGAAAGGYAIDLGGYDKNAPGTYTITIYYLDAFVTFDVVVSANSSVTFDDYSFVNMGK